MSPGRRFEVTQDTGSRLLLVVVVVEMETIQTKITLLLKLSLSYILNITSNVMSASLR